jgi:uncharacterized protein (DUF302 family)
LGSRGNGRGRIDLRSNFGPADTMNRLEAAVRAKGLTVFCAHQPAAAEEVGLTLRSTDLLIFGNAKGGTPLMQVEQTTGIDLPLKALVCQDEGGTTWLSYNDPVYIAKRHGLGHDIDASIHALAAASGRSPERLRRRHSDVYRRTAKRPPSR